jgi:hypothetical protein
MNPLQSYVGQSRRFINGESVTIYTVLSASDKDVLVRCQTSYVPHHEIAAESIYMWTADELSQYGFDD